MINIIQEVFNAVQCPMDCGECQHLVETKDAYGTGDSPSAWSCEGSLLSCPQVRKELEIAIEQLD